MNNVIDEKDEHKELGYVDLDALKRFNWGTFLMCPLWCLAYKQIGWFLLFVFISAILKSVNDPSALIIGAIVIYSFSAIIAVYANRIAWRVHGKKFGSIEATLSAQKKWVYWGLALTIAGVGLGYFGNTQ